MFIHGQVAFVSHKKETTDKYDANDRIILVFLSLMG